MLCQIQRTKQKRKNRATGDDSKAKAFATKNYDRTSISRTHKWMERTDFQKLSSDFHFWAMTASAPKHMHARAHKIKNILII